MLRTCTSEKGAGDCRRRGRRLFDFGALCGFGGSGGLRGLCGVGATERSDSWGTHSSERSSSQGCVVLLAMVVGERAGGWP